MIKLELTRKRNQLPHDVQGIKYLIAQLPTSVFNNLTLFLVVSKLLKWRTTDIYRVHVVTVSLDHRVLSNTLYEQLGKCSVINDIRVLLAMMPHYIHSH